MQFTRLLSISSLFASAYTAQVLLYETSPVCRSTSITLRLNVPEGPGGPCMPIPGTALYTAGKLGTAGPDMRLKIFTYQGANRCGAPFGEGSSASSCVTADGQFQLISGVGVSTGNVVTEEEGKALGQADAAGVVAYGYDDGKILHEIHRDSEHAAGYLELKTYQERSE